ncbi:hypothetical protein ACIQLJ_07210 [Microbacterium sp. NPDC091313]
MTARPLFRSIPFWLLFVGSLALTGLGIWLTLDRLTRIESAISAPTEASNIEVYVGQPAATVGGALLAAGLIGLFLTLTVATISSLLPRSTAVVEQIDWTSEEESAPEPEYTPAVAAAPAAASAADETASAEPAAPAAHTPSHGEPVIAEDPDVETPSTATAPPSARD